VKLPRDLSGTDLVRALAHLGYVTTRQTGSHVRLTTNQSGEHHITIPYHDPLKIGTLNSLLRDIGTHHGITRNEVIAILLK
jgi:predicted RNA binding protein YcfA (HicA-like mRNA interferase family)